MSRTEVNGGAMSRTGYILGGVAVVVIAFAVTLFALNYWSAPSEQASSGASAPAASSSTSGPAATQATALEALPKAGVAGLAWLGVANLNIQAVGGTPAVNGQPVMQLVAVPAASGSNDKRHRLAAQLTGLESGRNYRVAVWVKPIAGGDLGIEAADHASPKSSYGVGVFDLSAQKVLSTTAKAGIEPASDGWQKVWMDLLSANGQMFFNLYVANHGSMDFDGDGKTGLLLGGFAAEPQS